MLESVVLSLEGSSTEFNLESSRGTATNTLVADARGGLRQQ
jgi:hypothetical protein